MKPLPISATYQTAAEILAAAVLDLCPDAFIIEGRPTFTGFAYDFYFPSPFSKEMFPYLEERMRTIIQEDHKIERREMLPDNAAHLFRSYPRYYPALFAKQHPGPLIEIFQMNNFTDICPGPYLPTTREIGAIKLIEITNRPPIRYRGSDQPVTRITGIVCKDKHTLKSFLKTQKQLIESEHRSYGSQHGYFLIHKQRSKSLHEVHRCFWLPKGENLKEMLYHYWRESHKKEGYHLIQTQGNNLLNNHKECFKLTEQNLKKNSWKVAELSHVISEEGIDPWKGLFKSKNYSFDRAHIFCLKENLKQELNSSLQFVEKTSKLFHFESKVELSAPEKDRQLRTYLATQSAEIGIRALEKQGPRVKILWKIRDRYKSEYSGAFIELSQTNEGFIITHSIFNTFERFIALLMEAQGPSFEKRVKAIAKKTKFE